MASELNPAALDRYITGNYGEDQWPDHVPCVVHGQDCDADQDDCEPDEEYGMPDPDAERDDFPLAWEYDDYGYEPEYD
jgi:hypothetical protein